MKEILRLPPGCDGNLWYYDNPGRNYRMHRHAELELNLGTHGRATYLLDGRRVALARNTLLWLFPGQNHVLLDQSPDFQMWIVVWRPRLVRHVCRAPATGVLRRAKPTGNFCKPIAEAPARRLGALFDELAPAVADPVRFNFGLAYALLTSWTAFAAAQVVTSGALVHPAVERAARLVRDDPTIALAELARRAGLSASRLSRLFKRQTGVALVEFRSRQRLERFLVHTTGNPQLKLLDAALDAGFGSYAQFHRVFTRMMGCSPQRYRQTTAC